jgi:hypothetical protein
VFIAAALLSTAAQLFGAGPAAAQQSAALAQSFNASGNSADLVPGALVSTINDKSGGGTRDSVELAEPGNASRLVGVVGDKPLLTISDGNGQVTVILGGKAQALVSDINGPVKAGDRITVSPVSGIGMKATADSQVVGVAQSDQPAANPANQRTINDTGGKSHTIHVGSVPVQVGVASYQAPGSNFLPPVVQRLANSIAGKHVGFFRVLLSGTILVATICGMFILLHTAAKTSVISIGRNPIAAGAIHKGLRQVSLLAVAILVAGLAASYLLLKI